MRSMRWNAEADAPEVQAAELGQQGFLVPEVVIDGGRRVLDPRGDGSHGRGLVSMPHEHLARGIEDRSAVYPPAPGCGAPGYP